MSAPIPGEITMRAPVVAVVLALGLAAGCSSATQPAASSPSSAPTAAATSAPPPAPPALTGAPARFVAKVRAEEAAKGETSPESDAQIANIGATVCAARKAGGTQSAVIGTGAGKQVVTTAERILCPAYLPKVLIRFSGSGIRNSGPFTVASSTVKVRYSYDCSAFGGSGNFIADLETGNQSSLDSDDLSIANALSSHGSATTTVYPQNPGAQYHLAVNSECSWSLVVSSG
jgi:hypothetical protein